MRNIDCWMCCRKMRVGSQTNTPDAAARLHQLQSGTRSIHSAPRGKKKRLVKAKSSVPDYLLSAQIISAGD